MKKMRRKIVAGNWKMNLNLSEGKQLVEQIITGADPKTDVEIVLSPPFPHLSIISELIKNKSKMMLSAQNCSDQPSGALTGEVSAAMLKSAGVDYVIVGHSERRAYFGESDELLARKADIVLENNMTPIFCCGEPLDVREAEQHVDYVSQQLKKGLFHLNATQFSKMIIAYEPVWAIGTGVTASSEQAQEMHAEIRRQVRGQYGHETAEIVPILYGGSCKPTNAGELFACPDVDGGLIGGASLHAKDFLSVARSFPKL